MADTRDTRSQTQPLPTQRDKQTTARNPRMMREDTWGVPVHPFALMRRMHENLDRFFGSVHEWPSLFNEAERIDWTPAIETFQRGDEFIVRADLPGLARKDLAVEVGDDTLRIMGERAYDHDEEHEGVYRSERSYGSFKRVVPLPEGALSETAKASFKNGVLEVRMQAPSREARKGRRLEITEESPKSSER